MIPQTIILGNGISRLKYDHLIRFWKGEVWGCNRVYLDYGDTITALAGHTDVMLEAEKARVSLGHEYSIFGISENFTCPEIYRKDTGTTIVAEALTRGMDVICCGFDIGGLDVYSPDHEKKNKPQWVQRWRLILENFDPARITFWGYDHKPYLLSDAPAGMYARQYTQGKSHISDEEYTKQVSEWKNDYSRIYDLVPCVLLKNIGKRDWFFEGNEILKMGGIIKLSQTLAEKYKKDYRREFEILPLPD